MQTFLPYSSFSRSAKCLDIKRLGKQRIETKEILVINLHILYPDKYDSLFVQSHMPDWRYENHTNHPAVIMWRGYESALIRYGIEICTHWRSLGYKDNQLPFFQEMLNSFKESAIPPFIGDDTFHSSHRAALLAKNYEHYKKFGWIEEPIINYVWPTELKKI